jgi:hypothetical protein
MYCCLLPSPAGAALLGTYSGGMLFCGLLFILKPFQVTPGVVDDPCEQDRDADE